MCALSLLISMDMKKMKKTKLLTVFALLPFICTAATKGVYCSDHSGKKWEWLPTKEKVQGHFQYVIKEMNGSAYKAFTFAITDSDYSKLKNECQNYFYNKPNPQPADHYYSAWYSFSVNNSIKPGKNELVSALDMNHERDRKLYSDYLVRQLSIYQHLLERGMLPSTSSSHGLTE